MGKNNFQRLEEEELGNLPDLPLGIAHNVHNSLDNMRTLGGVVDLYLTKIIDVLIMMSGGTVDRSGNSFSSSTNHGTPTDPDRGTPRGPSGG
jgi:hypothetical protein